MMRTIASESYFLHGLIATVILRAVVVGDDKTYRAQKMSVVVWGSGA
jgi:hypothetical protein